LQEISKFLPKTVMALETRMLYEFGKYRLDPAEHLLLCEGKPVAITPKAFEILCVLAQNSGRLLSKEELMKRVWPNSFVEEANLSVNISALRKALGDTPDGQELIATVPKMGYRFVMPVREIRDVPQAKNERIEAKSPEEGRQTREPVARVAGIPVTASPLSTKLPADRAANRWAWVGVLGVIALAVLMYVGYRARGTRGVAPLSPRKMAILPFQNLNKDPNSDFLGFSLADAVIIKLGNISALSVRPSSAVQKYREQVIDIPKVAQELNVDTLLTGTFIREGNDLRVTTQLIDVKKQNILWRDTFDLKYEKLLRVQDDVAQEIIKGLALNLTPSEVERMRPGAPVNALAYEYYLRGVDLYSRGDFAMAIKMLEASIQIDPNYASTWAQLGTAYNANASFQFGGRDHYQKAQAAFAKALSLEPAQIETRVYMANSLTDTGKVEDAVPLLREALQANPNHAQVHWELGYAYRFAGMLRESAAECERARTLDLGVKVHTSTLNAYLYLGQYDRFIASLPSENPVAFDLFYRGFGEYYRGDWAAAARDFDRAYEMEPSLLQARIGEALSEGIRHQEAQGIALLHETERKVEERGVRDPEASYKIAQAYAMLGDKTSALRVLERSVNNGFFPYPYLASDPLLEKLRREGAFSEILKKARVRHEQFRQTYF
jgi:DNA-binding winged helix-turn-helix (wHTH) protein/TolB-like protein/Flp pilus assembly protein TadD